MNNKNRTFLGMVTLFSAIVLTVFLVTCGGDSDDNGNTSGCLNDIECGEGKLCDYDTGKCFDGECRATKDCPQGKTCKNFFCVAGCESDEDCETEGAKCYLPTKSCFGGDECKKTSDCAQPVSGQEWVTCSDLEGKCIPNFPGCTRDTLDEDCPAGFVCKAGMCAEKPPLCGSDEDCPAGFTCNLANAQCERSTECESGYCPDPVDGVCRRCPCDNDQQCAVNEWCDAFNYQRCRKKCTSDDDCVKSLGEECQEDGKCRASKLCELGEDCTSCACKEGLVCAADHRDPDKPKKCSKACDLYGDDCDEGWLCEPVMEGGVFPQKGGGCVLPNGGKKEGEPCDQANYCEANLLCQSGTCRKICKPGGEPSCGEGVDCTPYMGIGVCGNVVGCVTDTECGAPDKVCWDNECQPGCHKEGSPIKCVDPNPCDPTTGRCKGSGRCSTDADCSPPDTICDLDRQPPDCVPSCLTVGCPGDKSCDPTTGRCKDKCASDSDCNPPKTICEHDVCILGCNEPGGLDCGDQECITQTGRCGQVNYCEKDSDCNPPMTKCDEGWKQCVDGCGIKGCDAGYDCDNETGECVYNPCTHIGCPCSSTRRASGRLRRHRRRPW